MSVRKSFVFAAALAIALAGAFDAQARAGGGGSFGSRGSRSFSTIPSTRTAPSVSPLGAQPNLSNGGLLRPATGSRGMFGSFGRGLMGGLLGAGLIGMLFGNGLFGGLGGLMSMFGLLLQFGLLALVVMFAIRMFRSRQPYAPAAAASGASFRSAGPSPGGNSGSSFGGGAAQEPAKPLALDAADYAQFERSLVAVQTAFSAEDVAALRRLAMPEVAAGFGRELDENRARGAINRMSDIHFIRGDLAESWGEAGSEYASLAMRYGLIDAMIDRTTGRVVAGDANTPQEVTEVWTFVRPVGGRSSDWRLSAVQQGR